MLFGMNDNIRQRFVYSVGLLVIRYMIYPQIRFADTVDCSSEEDSGMLCRMIGFHDIGVWRKERPFNRKVTKNRADWGCLT